MKTIIIFFAALIAIISIVFFTGCETEQVTYAVRDTGPGGGLVFYDHGSYVSDPYGGDDWRYMEAAPWDQSAGSAFGCSASGCSTTGSTAIGDGLVNTEDWDTCCTTDGIAADLCWNLDLNGFDLFIMNR